jgi:23S rRNA (uridine2552-2'-O)-methyltransferase
MKRNRKTTRNQNRINEQFYQKAKEDGFLARSVYKLQEINAKYKILKPKSSKPFILLDLGCSPGSWLQHVASTLRESDKAIGIDIAPLSFTHKKINFIQNSIFDITFDEIININNSKVNTVISDMAPKTTGIRIQDQQGSLDLCYQALKIANNTLEEGGNFVTKIFNINSEDFKNYINETKKHFKKVYQFKPQSCRKESYELYVIGLEFKNLTK